MKRVLTEEEIPQDVIDKAERWHDKRKDFDPGAHAAVVHAVFQEILKVPDGQWDNRTSLRPILARFPKDGKGLYSKANLIATYRHMVAEGDLDPDPEL
ncbi:MAG: tRNA uridine(34) 5-carboxymethylaminomethyl modification radical SAM/GNAT enzyme Elp3, partial [Caldilineaceae bacterium]|nr:tRNA uridine(34) 5-carboxymethylaminomethyl modification radical SAM/GNAT enzyme Elp3 [Caldilineaceae bacterium]